MKTPVGIAFSLILGWVVHSSHLHADPPEDGGMAAIGSTGDPTGRPYRIDRYEYPNRQGEYPEVNVTWYEAQAKCQAGGKRLCTEREWGRACYGPKGYAYPYGERFDPDRCNTPYPEGGRWRRDRGTAKSGAFPGCVSDYGVYDMSGNVWEWTDGLYTPDRPWRVVRGGSWFQSVNLTRCDARYGYFLEPDYRLDLIGFRCCQTVEENRAKGQ